MSILDASVNVGVESVYGTPVTPTRSFEAKADDWKRAQSRLESVGFRANMQTLRSDRVTTVNMGGAGTIECDMLTSGMGMLLQGTLGTKAGPTQVDATSAYLQTFETSDSAPADSYTIQIIRPLLESGTQQFTHHGAKITGWGISQSVDGLLVLTTSFDSEDVDITTAAATPAYPASGVPFDWTQCTVTLDPDGSPVTLDLMDLSFDADLSLKTDRRYLRGSALKKEPVRSGVPTYGGSMSLDFTGTDRYDEFVAGTVVDIELAWAGAVIDAPEVNEFKLRMKACQFTEANPTVSLSDTPVQQIDFRALHNGTDAAVTMTYQSADTSA